MSDSHKRGGRRNRIPRDDGDAGHQAADRGRLVAFDQDLAGGLVHALGAEAGLLAERRLGVVEPGLERGHVQRQRLLLLRQLLGERLLHLAQLDVEQVRQGAVVDHVAHQAAQLGVGADGGDQLVKRHRIERHVGPQRFQVQRLVVDHAGAGLERQHVLARRLGVHRHEEINFLLPGDVPVLVGADRVPGRQAGDVGRKQVLAGHRDPHLEQRPDEDQVGGLAARAVDGGDLDAELVDRAAGRRGSGLKRRVGRGH